MYTKNATLNKNQHHENMIKIGLSLFIKKHLANIYIYIYIYIMYII